MVCRRGASRQIRSFVGIFFAAALIRVSQLVFAPSAFAGGSPTKLRGARGASASVHSHQTAVASESGAFLPLDTFEPAVSAYFASSPPLFPEMKEFFKENTFTGHWAHAIGGSLLFAYAAYAIFLGWQIRFGNGNTVYPFSYDQTARERHPYAMGIVLLFLFFEIPDGLTILAADEQPLLQSTHSSTAVVALVLMAIVGAIGWTMGGSKSARDAHAYAGTATVFALLIHAYFGLYLGWSF